MTYEVQDGKAVVDCQESLDEALNDQAVFEIDIVSPADVVLTLTGSHSARVSAYGSATVRASDFAAVSAYGSATVSASGSATVRASDFAAVSAYGSATVSAYDSATVSAYDSARVSAYGSATVRASDFAAVRASESARVSAYDSARVSASGSATVRASDFARVSASDSATVSAYGSATVSAYGSATVSASGSATVSASGSATVRAGSHVGVHLFSSKARVEGGVIINHVGLDLSDAAAWAGYYGVTITDDGNAVLYKATSPDLMAGEMYEAPTAYDVGLVVTAADWRADNTCGGGLHLSPLPFMAKKYRDSSEETRFLRVITPLVGLRPIGDKVKVRELTVLAEVDINGDDIEPHERDA